MKILLTILVSMLLVSDVFTQYRLSGKVTDCSDHKPLMHASVFLRDSDTSYWSFHCDEQGNFAINIPGGYYKMSADFHYYHIDHPSFSIFSDTIINLCGTLSDKDTVLYYHAEINLCGIITDQGTVVYYPAADDRRVIYYFGLPVYSEEQLNEIGKQFFVEWINVGCESNDAYEKNNEMIRMANARWYGEDWEEIFWAEVKKRYK